MSNVLKEIQSLVKVEISIDEKALSDMLFNKVVDPLMLKLVDIIPTEFDNAFYAAKKSELQNELFKLLSKGVDSLEDKVGIDLDGDGKVGE